MATPTLAPLQAEALALATHLDHPVYDCLYLVLARREVAGSAVEWCQEGLAL